MDSIRSVNQILNILKRKITTEKRRTNASESSNTTTDISRALNKPVSSLDKQVLQSLIGRKIGALDSADPDYKIKASKILVESVLAWRFGDSVLQDPGFYSLENEVISALNMDEGVKGDLERLFVQLRSNK